MRCLPGSSALAVCNVDMFTQPDAIVSDTTRTAAADFIWGASFRVVNAMPPAVGKFLMSMLAARLMQIACVVVTLAVGQTAFAEQRYARDRRESGMVVGSTAALRRDRRRTHARR